MIQRYAEKLVSQSLNDGFVTILYGARQVGKTTLAKKILSQHPNGIYLNCDDPEVVAKLQNQSLSSLSHYLTSADLVVIDEAQRVENIGLTAKLIHDSLPDKKLLLTGSSSLDLANKVKEPLTGRSNEILLYPLSLGEATDDPFQQTSIMQRMLVYGGYPGIWTRGDTDAAANASTIANQYLYRDAFAQGVVYNQVTVDNLLRNLAHQVGNEVSYSELASSLEVSKETVMRYIYLLEQAFIIFRMPQFRKNQRTQIGRLRKVYFYDIGIRNALVNNFRPLELRDDIGALWENFVLLERLKHHQINQQYVRSYYWRSRDKQEVDLVEESSSSTQAFECKWSKDAQISKGFTRAYPDIHVTTINKHNFSQKLYL